MVYFWLEGAQGGNEWWHEKKMVCSFLFTWSDTVYNLVYVCMNKFIVAFIHIGRLKVFDNIYYPNSFQDAGEFKSEVPSRIGLSHWEPDGFGIGCLQVPVHGIVAYTRIRLASLY